MVVNVPLAELFVKHLGRTVTPNTHRCYRRAIEKFIGFAGTRPVSKEIIAMFRASLLEAGLSPSSVNLYMTMMNGFFRWAMDQGMLQVWPVPWGWKLRVEKPDREPMTEADMEAIWAVATPKELAWWKLPLQVANATGLRIGDVALLDVSALRLDVNTIRVKPQKTRRMNRWVEVPITPNLMSDLLAQSAQVDRAALDPAFLQALTDKTKIEKPQPIFAEMARTYLRNHGCVLFVQFLHLRRRAGVTKSLHCIRHGVITRLVARSGNPLLVAELMGISLARVQTYYHSSLEEKRAVLNV